MGFKIENFNLLEKIHDDKPFWRSYTPVPKSAYLDIENSISSDLVELKIKTNPITFECRYYARLTKEGLVSLRWYS